MKIPDKLSYTSGEKAAEISCGISAALLCAAEVVMMAAGLTGGENMIFLVVMLIIYGVFSLCSVYPQHTNIFGKPEEIYEKAFHAVRRGCIISRAVLMAALFILSLPIFG